jgi:hypothetical protein
MALSLDPVGLHAGHYFSAAVESNGISDTYFGCARLNLFTVRNRLHVLRRAILCFAIGASIVRKVGDKSGVNVPIRIICGRNFYERNVVAKLGGKASR